MDKEQKDKILEYLCKKFSIEKFFIHNATFYNTLYAKMLNSPSCSSCSHFSSSFSSFSSSNSFLVFAETTPIFINDTTKQTIDILLQEAKENDIFVGHSLKILEKGTTIEQLAIDSDLGIYA